MRCMTSLRAFLLCLVAGATAAADPSPVASRPPAAQGVARTAAGAPRARRSRARRELPPSASVGWANGGSLVNGRELRESDGVRFLPGRTLHHGTEELVGLLERVGRQMRRRVRAPITVGDLSAECGGRVIRHRSHQSGRDADIAFFMRERDARGNLGDPVLPDDYVSFTALGVSLDERRAFDTARNWALVEALLTDPQVVVERIFVARAQRAALLRYARGRARPEVFVRAQWAMLQPAHVSVHDNHFHVRIACPRGDAMCREGVRTPPRPARRRGQRAELRRADHPSPRATPARPRR